MLWCAPLATNYYLGELDILGVTKLRGGDSHTMDCSGRLHGTLLRSAEYHLGCHASMAAE